MAFFRLEWRASAAKELRKIDRQMIPRIVEAQSNWPMSRCRLVPRNFRAPNSSTASAWATTGLCTKWQRRMRVSLLSVSGTGKKCTGEQDNINQIGDKHGIKSGVPQTVV